MKTMRLFIAIPVPGHIKKELVPAQKILGEGNPHVRIVPPTGIHLTLKFLGDTAPNRIRAVRVAMEKAAATVSEPIRLQCERTGVFPDIDKPRVLWAGLEGDIAALIKLHRILDRVLADAGFAAEKLPFHPHLTLGRVRAPKMLGSLRKAFHQVESLRFGEFEAEALVLYESELQPTGAVYTSIERIVLPRSGGAR
ncbi:MAG: RNA 2',3'-cyclic phosphodiesterase [Candidatus Lernaella stagnicola]|nr:RNA 2',3'-cyclic phosphodiesterase [Candidatus Lernaella stagnicola]